MMIYFLVGVILAVLDIGTHLWKRTLRLRFLPRLIWSNVFFWPLLMLKGFVKHIVFEMKKNKEL